MVGATYVAWGGLIVIAGAWNWEAECRNGAGYVATYSATPTVTTNAWHFVELYWLNSATVGKAILYVDGIAVQTNPNSATNAYGNADTVRVGVDTVSTAFSATAFSDLITIDTSYIPMSQSYSYGLTYAVTMTEAFTKSLDLQKGITYAITMGEGFIRNTEVSFAINYAVTVARVFTEQVPSGSQPGTGGGGWWPIVILAVVAGIFMFLIMGRRH